jgi:FHA domain/Zinc-ribbon containing domain
MDSMSSETILGAGSFRCQHCGYVLVLASSETLVECPGCEGRSFVRASLFGSGESTHHWSCNSHIDDPIDPARLAEIREGLERSGEYLAFSQDGHEKVVALTREWTRIGRSLTGDLRLDDPTVSRRHALLGRQPDGVRLLDDRSLNGVFVNGERVEWTILGDGDEIEIGRYRLNFISLAPDAERFRQRFGSRPRGRLASGRVPLPRR